MNFPIEDFFEQKGTFTGRLQYSCSMLQETLLGILEIHKGKSLPEISIGKVRGDQQKQSFADVCYKIGVLSNFKKFTGKRQC